MRIDYCPYCGKSGLRHHDNRGLNANGLTDRESYEQWVSGESKIANIFVLWCPRCKEWVKPENHPYVGTKGIK